MYIINILPMLNKGERKLTEAAHEFDYIQLEGID